MYVRSCFLRTAADEGNEGVLPLLSKVVQVKVVVKTDQSKRKIHGMFG